MGLLNFFRRSKKEKKEERIFIPKTPEQTGIRIFCDYCQNEIFEWEKRKKVAGKSYHLRCLKRIRKQARKITFG